MGTACEQRLLQHSAYLDELIGMVPAKFYLPTNPEELSKRFQKHVGKPAAAVSKHQHKLEATERRRAKLDPSNHVGAVELAAAKADAEEREDAEFRLREARPGDGGGDAGSGLAPDMPLADFAQRSGGSQQLSAQELRRRLAERLQELRAGRGGTADGRSDAPPKVAHKPKHNPPSRAAGAPAAASSSSADAGAPSSSAAAASSSRSSAGALEFNQLHAGGAAGSKRKGRPADLLALAGGGARKRGRGSGGSIEGEGEDTQIEVWQKALEKAGGIKQRDDPKLLKKMLKRKERAKKKSKKEWKARTKSVAAEMMERQTKRKENLKARMTKSKAKVARAKAVAAGQDRAGFEGKKRSFLN
jgi:hypothetical protein